MEIKFKSGHLEILTYPEFIEEVVKIVKNIKELQNNQILLYFFETKKQYEFKNKKQFEIAIKSMFYNITILSSKYWISRGWTEEEANTKIKEEQVRRNSLYMQKKSIMKENDLEEWKALFNTNLEFYLKKGHTLEEAKNLRKKRQKTFSKDICIEKYGLEDGVKIWKSRQEKWISSVSNATDSASRNSKSASFFKRTYSQDWIIECINKNFSCNRELIKNAIIASSDVDEFCNYIFNNKNIYSINELASIFQSSVISEYFEITKIVLRERLVSKYGIIPTKYGSIRYFNGHICRSNGEYHIAKKLVENGIEYIYEKKYPNSNFVSDFYIVNSDLYIEYMGFLKNDFFTSTNKKICDHYKERLEEKKKFCTNNKINFIFDSDHKNLTNKIINYERS
jgi:hypothetical protein